MDMDNLILIGGFVCCLWLLGWGAMLLIHAGHVHTTTYNFENKCHGCDIFVIVNVIIFDYNIIDG